MCSDGLWPCETGVVCLNRTFLCDGVEHCYDGSDERVGSCKIDTG